jgi:hypothetical protein
VTVPDYAKLRDSITDVTVTTPHEYEILKVYAGGLIAGYPDKTFRPAGTLTRAEAATVIWRLMNEDKRVVPDLSETPAAPETPVTGGKTTLERFYSSDVKSELHRGIFNVIYTSESTKPLSEIVDNSFADLYPSGSYDNIRCYEIMDDYPYQMGIRFNLYGGEILDLGIEDAAFFIKAGGAVLIKGRTMTELEDPIDSIVDVLMDFDPSMTGKFPDFDYIGVYSEDYDTMILVPNNLK